MTAHIRIPFPTLKEAIAAAAASREASHARLVRTIKASIANVDEALARQRRERRASEEGIASFMERSLGKVVRE